MSLVWIFVLDLNGVLYHLCLQHINKLTKFRRTEAVFLDQSRIKQLSKLWFSKKCILKGAQCF